MYRSFTHRVFGGVCGGLGAALHITPWLLRVLFILFTLVSFGLGAILYVVLWWAMPMESLVEERYFHLPSLLMVLAALVLLVGGWALQTSGQLSVLAGREIFLPLVLMTVCGAFLLRQIGGQA